MLKSRRDSLLLFGIPFLATFLAYLKTVCPTVYTGDSGEFSLVISTLGIAHPPGYPLLTLLGKVFITIIPGNQAHVLNTLSALLASASAGLGAYVVRAIMFLPENRNEIQAILISILTAILWGYSNALWASAVGIEVYTFSVCLTMLSLFALLRFFDTGQVRYLLFSIYIFCLGLTNHLSIAALAIPLFVAMLRARLPLRVWLLSISLFILALSAYLYLPIRSAHNPISDWDHPARLSTLIAHITARRYQGLVSGFTVGNYYENIWRSLIIIGEQFPLWLGILGIIGIAFAPGTRKNIRLTLVIIVIFNLLTVGLYDIPDIEQYYLISIFLSCVGLIFLVKWVLSTVLPRRWEIGAIVVMAIIAIGALGANYKQNDQSNNLLARDYGANILSSIPSNSVLVLVGDNASTSVNYLHYVEHIRLDLEIYDPIVTVGLLRDRLGLARGVSGPSEQELCMKILQGPKAYIVKEHLLRRGAPINYDALTLSPMGLVYHVGKWPLVPAIRENEQILTYENQLNHLDIKGIIMLCNVRLCSGEDLLAAGDTTSAQYEFRTAVDLASHSGEASLHNSMGIFFRRAHQPNLAEMEYAKALKSWHLTANEKANIYTNLGNLKKDRGMFDEAIGFYQQAIDLNEHNTDAKYNLALVQAYQGVSRGEYRDAIDGFESALGYPEADPKLIFNLAILYDQKLRDTVRAIESYTRFTHLAPSLPESQMALRRIKELSP